MKVLITDLTRMYDGHICAAGIDVETQRRVRPVLPSGERLSANFLADRSGPLDISRIVDFGPVRPCGTPPEVEDVEFRPPNVRALNYTGEDEFFAALAAAASSLSAIGPTLTKIGGALATPQGRGDCSLVVVASTRAYATITQYSQVRAPIEDQWFSVTDVRLHKSDLKTPDPARVESLMQAEGRTSDVFFCVGLARAWQKPGDTEPRHYAQINNIHIRGWPEWRLA